MKGEEISQDHTIARYCGGSSLNEEGNPVAAAFTPREEDTYLSVHGLELTEERTRDQQVHRMRQIIEEQPFTLRAQAKFALLKVSKVLDHVRENSLSNLSLNVLYEPPPSTHCGIHNYSHNDLEISQLISECVFKTYPAKG